MVTTVVLVAEMVVVVVVVVMRRGYDRGSTLAFQGKYFLTDQAPSLNIAGTSIVFRSIFREIPMVLLIRSTTVVIG